MSKKHMIDVGTARTEAISSDTDSFERGSDTYSNFDRVLDIYAIQPVFFGEPSYGIDQSIYFSSLLGNPSRTPKGVRLQAGDKIGFNNYINSFYAAYWIKYTTVSVVSLRGAIVGTGILHLFRSSSRGQTIRVGSFPIGTGPGEHNVFGINFELFSYLPSDGGPGRYFFDIEAVSDMDISQLAYGSFVSPARNPALSVGICTYKKEEYVSNITMRLANFMHSHPQLISDVFVVNNDQTLDNLPVLADLDQNNSKFHVVSQSNIGGAGGFARTLNEAINLSDSTYHVFMDDDIFLDPAIFERLWAFLAYARKDIIVGGQMMDMQCPNVLYEGGAKLDYWGFLQKVGSSLDATSHIDATFFDKVRDVDYNAWWFACVPKGPARDVGLPLNIFIRGDDFEFGLRLKAKADIETVSMPGIYVWHEPFEGKTSSWLEYYNWRNRFMICALYADPKRLSIQPIDMLRDIVVDNLEAGNQEIVFVMCRAMIDFIAGPDTILSQDAEKLHSALRAAISKLKQNPGNLGKLLEDHLKSAALSVPTRQVIRCAQSPRLGGRNRSAADISWIEQDFLPTIDKVLGCYELHVDSAVQEWQNKAHKLSSQDAWTALYWTGEMK